MTIGCETGRARLRIDLTVPLLSLASGSVRGFPEIPLNHVSFRRSFESNDRASGFPLWGERSCLKIDCKTRLEFQASLHSTTTKRASVHSPETYTRRSKDQIGSDKVIDDAKESRGELMK
jgi:hypothetical protein